MRILAILALLLLTTPNLYGKMPYDAVCVLHKGETTEWGGSGTLVAFVPWKGLILTQAHVINDVTEINATWPAFKATRKAKPVYVSYGYDIALLVVDRPPCEPVRIATSLGRKEELISTGFPWYSRNHLQWQKGTVDAFEAADANVTNRVAAGMSGGGVFNWRGSLAGTVKAIRNDDKTKSVIVTLEIIVPIILAYSDPETWRPLTNHMRPNTGNSAQREAKDKTQPYDEKTAPDLSDDDPKTSNKIETKVPAEK